jgi:RNA polymerase sigma-70 factor (ECF subfamily)
MAANVGAEPRADSTAASDADLIGRVSEGDAQALELLYDRYSRVVYSFALRIVGDPQLAEELLQEVFLRTWQQGSAFRAARGTFITWLLSITHNMAIDEVRKRRRRPQRADNEEPEAVLAAMMDEGQDVEEEVWLSSLRATIATALEVLPPAQREAIELAYFQGLTQREIAERLGEPLGTIKTRMRLGIQKLREQLGDQFGDLAQRSEVDEA